MPPRTKRVSDDAPVVSSKPIHKLRVQLRGDGTARDLLVRGTVDYIYQNLRDGALNGWWYNEGWGIDQAQAWGRHVIIPTGSILWIETTTKPPEVS